MEEEGWVITNDSLNVKVGTIPMQIDLDQAIELIVSEKIVDYLHDEVGEDIVRR